MFTFVFFGDCLEFDRMLTVLGSERQGHLSIRQEYLICICCHFVIKKDFTYFMLFVVHKGAHTHTPEETSAGGRSLRRGNGGRENRDSRRKQSPNAGMAELLVMQPGNVAW